MNNFIFYCCFFRCFTILYFLKKMISSWLIDENFGPVYLKQKITCVVRASHEWTMNRPRFVCYTTGIYKCFILLQGLFTPSFRFYALMLLHVFLLEITAYLVVLIFGTWWLPFSISALLQSIYVVSIIR